MNFDTSLFSKRRRITQNLMFTLFRIFSYSIVAILFFILGFIIVKGIGVISWDFITQAPSDGMTKGGIWPAIVGTFYLMIGSALFAFPIGIMSGIYMNEYARSGKIVNFIRTMTNNLAGIPSIVFGLFGMAFFVNRLNFGDSILAGSLTLGLLALPIIIRTTEETFKDIPSYFREGSMALGATKAQTIWKVLLPMATPQGSLRDSYSRWDVSRERQHLSCSPAQHTFYRNCRPVFSTSVWHCLIIFMSLQPAEPMSKHNNRSLTEQHLSSSSSS